MININNTFLSKMLEEIGYAYQNGVSLKTPITKLLPSKKINNNELLLPNSLLEFYNQTSKLEILWEIYNSDENLKQFKENTFIKEKYLDKDYDWGVISEYLSGYINITSSENILASSFQKNQGYYYTLQNNDEYNQDDFLPFDICWNLTACLKKEGDKIEDNIWVIYTDANEVYNMDISIEKYLNLAYQSKCFHYWQLIYLFKEKVEYYELMKLFLPKIFSHTELDLKEFNI